MGFGACIVSGHHYSAGGLDQMAGERRRTSSRRCNPGRAPANLVSELPLRVVSRNVAGCWGSDLAPGARSVGERLRPEGRDPLQHYVRRATAGFYRLAVLRTARPSGRDLAGLRAVRSNIRVPVDGDPVRGPDRRVVAGTSGRS